MVQRPREEVYSFLADPRNLPAWIDPIADIELEAEPAADPVREGTRFAQHLDDAVAEEGPARFEGRIDALEPPRRVAFSFEGDSGRVRTVFRVEDARDGTRVTEELEVPLTRLATKLLAPFLWFANRSRLKRHLAELKHALETDPPATGHR